MRGTLHVEILAQKRWMLHSPNLVAGRRFRTAIQAGWCISVSWAMHVHISYCNTSVGWKERCFAIDSDLTPARDGLLQAESAVIQTQVARLGDRHEFVEGNMHHHCMHALPAVSSIALAYSNTSQLMVCASAYTTPWVDTAL